MIDDDDQLGTPDVVIPTRRTRGWLSTYWHNGREVGLSYPVEGPDDPRHYGFFLNTDTLLANGDPFDLRGDASVNEVELANLLLLFRNAAAKRIIASDFCSSLLWLREDDYLSSRWSRPWWLDGAWRTEPADLVCMKALYQLDNLHTSFDRYVIGVVPLYSTERETSAVRAKLLGYPVYDLGANLVDQLVPVD